jgi:hypothetical protein
VNGRRHARSRRRRHRGCRRRRRIRPGDEIRALSRARHRAHLGPELLHIPLLVLVLVRPSALDADARVTQDARRVPFLARWSPAARRLLSYTRPKERLTAAAPAAVAGGRRRGCAKRMRSYRRRRRRRTRPATPQGVCTVRETCCIFTTGHSHLLTETLLTSLIHTANSFMEVKFCRGELFGIAEVVIEK